MNPILTIVIPTYNRQQLLHRAVQSALNQQIETVDTIEVLVVDDGSPQPVSLPAHPRLRTIRLSQNRGGAAARNEGAKAARGKYLTYLDDDDQLLHNMAQTALQALQTATLPPPVAVLSGVAVINSAGDVVKRRIPPTLKKGSHYALEEISPEKSFHCKQTMVVERSLLLSIGGFDESFQSRVHTEFFLRLNQACSILGLANIAYQLSAHEGPRVSRNPALRQVSFSQLITKHRDLFEAHPKQFARFVYKHAQVSLRMGQKKAALESFLWAFRIHPQRSARLVVQEARNSISERLTTLRTNLKMSA